MVKANWKISIKTRTKDKSFSNQKNPKILKDIFENKIKYIKKKDDLLKNALVNVQKRKRFYLKRIKENSKNAESLTK